MNAVTQAFRARNSEPIADPSSAVIIETDMKSVRTASQSTLQDGDST